MSERSAIFILGMHRSGTSALARVTHLLGAALPQRMVPAGLGNELGHWEPQAAVALHDRLLHAAGTSVNGLAGPPDAWFETPEALAFVAPMRELIEAEFAGQPLFVFKDPRGTLALPLWRRALADLGVRCLPVVMLRHPAEVAASLVARQNQAVPWQTWTLDRAGLLWLRYTLAAERHTRGGVRAWCTYADLLANWQGAIGQLASDLGLTWPRSVAEAAPDVDAFLDASQRHQHARMSPGTRGGVWSAWIAPAFEALTHARTDGPAQETLDRIGRSFTDVCASVHPTVEASTRTSIRTRGEADTKANAPANNTFPTFAGQRHLCLVVTPFMLEAEPLRLLTRLLEAMARDGTSITVIPVGDFQEAQRRSLAALATAHRLEAGAWDGAAPPIEPAFLRTTIDLFRHLRSRAFDVVLFPDRGGPGYASVTAKEAGLAFAQATLGILAFGTSRRQRERDRGFPPDLVTLSIEYVEQQAIERADEVFPASQEVAQWMRKAGWRWRDGPAPGAARSGDLVANVLEALLASGTRTKTRSADPPPAEGITVVISHFERSRLLEQNLQALEAQSDSDFSVLVVDDGSRDADALRYLDDLEQRYRHLGLRLIRQANRYLGAARNTGIRAATTELVILLDDDNLAFPTMVATLRQAMRSTHADIVTFGIRHFRDATGRPDEATTLTQGPDQFFAGGPVLVGAVHNCFGDASAIYRRAAFEQVGYFHEQHGVGYEDWQMHLRVAAAGLRLISLPEVLVWYRVHASSMLQTTHRHDNARVIASVIQGLPCSALEPLGDFLIGQEEERVRQNHIIESTRAVTAVNAAVLAEAAVDARQQAAALEQMLETRTQDARTAEHYARSLEAELSQARASSDSAAEYARSLEAARAVAEAYARSLETELAKWRAGPAHPSTPPQST